MKTVGQVIKLSCEYIKAKNVSQGRLEVEHLIAHMLGLKRLDLYLKFDQPLNLPELDKIRQGLAKLAMGMPLAYIEGAVSFYGCSIDVDGRVLIPRPETELMVEHIVKQMPKKKMKLVDVCTGSGCIGIAIKKACPELDVTLSDISLDALNLATHNAQKNGVEVACVLGNLLEPCQKEQLDFIVCNPPYVKESDYLTLDPHVKNFEPKEALVSGPTGYECYEALAKTLPKTTTCWLEVGAAQADHVSQLFKNQGFENIKQFFDYAGHARFLEIRVK